MPDETIVAPVVPAAPVERRYQDNSAKFEEAVTGYQWNPSSGQSEKIEAPVIETSSAAPVSTETNTVVSTETSAPVISTSTATSTQDPNAGGNEPLLAGKFKNQAELIHAYEESQRAFHTKSQELADIKKKGEQAQPAPVKTPEQIAQEKADLLNKIIENPEAVTQEIEQRVSANLEAQRKADAAQAEWKAANADIAQYEKFVGYEMQSLMAADPTLANDPTALLAKATLNFRANVFGTIREAGKREALQVSTSVTPLAPSKIQTPPPTEQPVKAPKTTEQVNQEHMDMLKANAARVRRPLR